MLLDRCIRPDGGLIAFGTPALRWTSPEARDRDEAIVLFAGASRVIDLGKLVRDGDGTPSSPWVLELALSTRDTPPPLRQKIGTGTKIRLIVGSEESDAKFYDLLVGWRTDAEDDQAVLGSLAIDITALE